jgi:hypothetical protein
MVGNARILKIVAELLSWYASASIHSGGYAQQENFRITRNEARKKESYH